MGRKESNQTKQSKGLLTGIFLVFSGAEIRPHSQWNLGDFSQFWKTIPIIKKKIFFFEDCDFHSATTHTGYMVTIYYHWILFLLQYFDSKSMCNSYFVFFINQKWHNCAL